MWNHKKVKWPQQHERGSVASLLVHVGLRDPYSSVLKRDPDSVHSIVGDCVKFRSICHVIVERLEPLLISLRSESGQLERRSVD